MTQTAPATPCLAKVPLDADRQAYALLIVHADRATRPSLTLAASAVVLYLVVWCPLYRKAGRALGHPRQTSS